MEWFTLRVISGKEKKIKEAIMYDVSLSSLEEFIGDILVPSENIVEMKDGKKKVKEKVFFPGYLLVRLEMNKETKYLLENVKKGNIKHNMLRRALKNSLGGKIFKKYWYYCAEVLD